MKKVIHILFLLLPGLNFLAQKKSGDTIGAMINEKILVYTPYGTPAYLRIPDKGYYLLVYRYKGTDPSKVETIDSVRVLEEKISKYLLGGMLGDLKVICLTYDSKAEFSGWQEKMKKEKPFKPSSKYTVEYYSLNGEAASSNRCRELFTKVNLFGPDGKLISHASTVSKFKWYISEDRITVKGKIVTDDNGKTEPLNNVDVHIEAPNKDTIAKGTTDKFGDFAVKIPNNDTNYTVKAIPKDRKVKSVILMTQEGKKIAKLQQNFKAFEYKLLKADLLEMAEMKVDEDIQITFKKFETAKTKELLVIEDIIYAKDQFSIDADAAEILTKVVNVLKENDKVTVEVFSHTDAQGDDRHNMDLSQKRASAVAEYLASKGISSSRIKAAGKGESEIRNRCVNGVGCTDKEHGYNRRTEFKFSK